MNEVVEQINHYKWVLIHHRWLSLSISCLICIIGWTYIQFIPNKYVSDTRVYIDTQTALRSLLSGLTVESDALGSAARVMERTLLIRPNLEKVIAETDLKLSMDDSDPLEKENLLNALAKNIQISSDEITRGESRNIYTISYTHTNPQLAKDVVEVLLSTFVETILGTSRRDSSSAQDFLDSQIALYDQKQRVAEEKLKDFKQKYSRTMPADGSSFYSRLSIMENMIQETQLTLKEAESRSESLRNKLAALLNTVTENTMQEPTQPDSMDERILNLEKSLDELLLHFTEQHPDVISTRRVLDQLKQEKQQDNDDTVSATTGSKMYDSPMLQELNILISESEAEISALRARLSEYQARSDEMNELIVTLPEIEAELVSLNRDYEINRELYQELVMRRESSQLSTLAEQTGEELQFRVLEPPLVAIVPASPDRIKLESLVLIAAIGIGFGIAILHEQLSRTFFTSQQLKESFNLPVLGVVTIFLTRQETSRRRMGIVFFCLATLIWLSAYAVLVASHMLDINLVQLLS